MLYSSPFGDWYGIATHPVLVASAARVMMLLIDPTPRTRKGANMGKRKTRLPARRSREDCLKRLVAANAATADCSSTMRVSSASGPPARHRVREDAVRRAATARPDCPQDQ